MSSGFVTPEEVLLYRPPTPEEVVKIFEKNRKLLQVIYRCLTGANARLDLIDVAINSCRRALHRNLTYLATHLEEGVEKNWCLHLLKESGKLPEPIQGSRPGSEISFKCPEKDAENVEHKTLPSSMLSSEDSVKEPSSYSLPLSMSSSTELTFSDGEKSMRYFDIDKVVESEDENLLPEFLFVARLCSLPMFRESSTRPLELDSATCPDHNIPGILKDKENLSLPEDSTKAGFEDETYCTPRLPCAVANTNNADVDSFLVELSPVKSIRGNLPSHVTSLLDFFQKPLCSSHCQDQLQFQEDVSRQRCFCSTSLNDIVSL